MRVYEVMSPNPRTISIASTVGDALEALRTLDVRHLPVVNEDRELVGMVSDRDLFGPSRGSEATEEAAGSASAWLGEPLGRVMSSNVLSLDQDEGIEAVIDLLLENRIGAVPVVSSEGRLVGIVSYVDLLRLLARVATQEPAALERAGAPPRDEPPDASGADRAELPLGPDEDELDAHGPDGDASIPTEGADAQGLGRIND